MHQRIGNNIWTTYLGVHKAYLVACTEVDTMYALVNLENHWFIVTVDMNDGILLVYDSKPSYISIERWSSFGLLARPYQVCYDYFFNVPSKTNTLSFASTNKQTATTSYSKYYDGMDRPLFSKPLDDTVCSSTPSHNEFAKPKAIKRTFAKVKSGICAYSFCIDRAVG
ncbi:unnamed protein product [Citrullus colocynthis]|uniref:Ubiquitin-like protease family profile domain-containing protein n=1 Tax=Citrullus colocynthis TaxID=252529 RepID=A0ABP0XTQ7_9ROSI